mgnify:FL=1
MRGKATGKIMAIVASFGVEDVQERRDILRDIEEDADVLGIDDYRTLRVMVVDYLKERIELEELDIANDLDFAGTK